VKHLLITITATLVCVAAFGQGKLEFINNIDNLIYFTTDTSRLLSGDRLTTYDGGYGAGAIPLAGQTLYTGGTIAALASPTTFTAGLWAGTSSGSLNLITTTTLSDAANAGLINPVSITTGFPAGTPVWFQVQVYDSRGHSAAEAWALNCYAGVSQVFQAIPQAADYAPIFLPSPSPVNSTWAPGTFVLPDLPGFDGWYGGIAVYAKAVPEPGTFALIGLGAAVLMIFRRRPVWLVVGLALLLTLAGGLAQGTFQNLDFESTLIDSGVTPRGTVTSIPSWSASYNYPGGSGTPVCIYDGESLSGPMVAIVDALNVGAQPLEGDWSAWVFGGRDGGGNPCTTTISQTGLVPYGVVSIHMAVSADNGFTVSLGGQTLSMQPLQSFPSYTLYGGDVSGFAGQTAQLSITAPAPPYPLAVPMKVLVDDITFVTIPEPSLLGVFALGVVLAGMRLFRRGRCQPNWTFNGQRSLHPLRLLLLSGCPGSALPPCQDTRRASKAPVIESWRDVPGQRWPCVANLAPSSNAPRISR
jgi:hypothetical protein